MTDKKLRTMMDTKLRTKLIEQIDNLSRGKGDWVGQIRGVVKTCDQATQLARAEERSKLLLELLQVFNGCYVPLTMTAEQVRDIIEAYLTKKY